MDLILILILGVISVTMFVLSIYSAIHIDKDWPIYALFIMICFGIVLLGQKTQCVRCGYEYPLSKIYCPQCRSHESTEINIDSVDIYCNEVNIHKIEKKNICDEDAKQWTCECGQINTGNYCQNCGNEK